MPESERKVRALGFVAKGHGSSRRECMQRPVMMVARFLPSDPAVLRMRCALWYSGPNSCTSCRRRGRRIDGASPWLAAREHRPGRVVLVHRVGNLDHGLAEPLDRVGKRVDARHNLGLPARAAGGAKRGMGGGLPAVIALLLQRGRSVWRSPLRGCLKRCGAAFLGASQRRR